MLTPPGLPPPPMPSDRAPDNASDPPAVTQAGSGYRLEMLCEGDTFLVRVHGTVDAQALRIAYWREIVDLAKAGGHRKLLVTDRKKIAPATPEELAELTRLFAHEARHFDRVAVVEVTPAFVPAIEHAEIFARSVGINLRVFADRDSALRWLYYAHSDEE
jgi:hypothetical protein